MANTIAVSGSLASTRDRLQTLGIETWTPRLQPALGPSRAEVPVSSLVDEVSPVTVLEKPPCGTWGELEQEVRTCTRCALHETRTQTVFGVGNRNASWLFIGEAPGEQEDLQGEPFVGRAGQLLNEMIKALGLTREDVYIANVLKCRPPQNRDPSPAEAASCESYLQSQVALIKPDIIMAVGRIAAQNLLKSSTPIGKLRGQVHDYQGIPLVVTYHPAYLLRSQTEKRRAWEDLKLARRTIAVPATPGFDSSQ